MCQILEDETIIILFMFSLIMDTYSCGRLSVESNEDGSLDTSTAIHMTGEQVLKITSPAANLTGLVSNTSAYRYSFVNLTVSLTIKEAESQPISDSDFINEPKKELPIAMIIAAPAAAFGIFLFLCIAFYFHNAQLNQNAKRLSYTICISPDQITESTTCDGINNETNCRTPHILVPASTPVLAPRSPSPSPTGFGRQHSRESTLSNISVRSNNSQRRKSTLTVPTLNVPGNPPMGKRGSNLSAIADQELLILSAPKRHSTFIF